jgi:GTP-binding protein
MGLGRSTLFWTAWQADQVPPPKFPRLIVAGRSNVGKSTLLNLITHPEQMFRKGSRAGLTQGLICVDLAITPKKHIELIDTPGWGYTKRIQNDRHRWVELLETLKSDSFVDYPRLWVLLADPLREPFEEEKYFLSWLNGEAFALVFTKSDKVKKSAREQSEKNWRAFVQSSSFQPLWVSAHNRESLKEWHALVRDVASMTFEKQGD